jgi:hypothetical protein
MYDLYCYEKVILVNSEFWSQYYLFSLGNKIKIGFS